MKRTATVVRWLLVVLLIACLPYKASFAQDPNNNYCLNPQGAEVGGFTVNKTRVCVGSAVTVTGGIPSGLVNIGYLSQYSGKGISTNLEVGPSFTYTKPGSYTILQVGTINGLRALSCQTITILPLDPISILVKSCPGQNVTVVPTVSTLGQYDTYVINWGDGNIDELTRAAMETNPEHTYTNTGSNTRTITVEGVYGPVTAPLCKTPFTQTVTLVPDATQPAITTLKTVSDKSITLQFQAGTGAQVQLYQKINGVYTDTGQKGIGSGQFTVQTDAKQVQCFQVVSPDVCSNTGLRSEEVCSLVLDVKADNKKNHLSWQSYGLGATAGQFRYFRITRNNAPIGGTIVNPSTVDYTDADNIVCGTQYCYSLVATIAGKVAQTEISSASVCVTGVSGDVPDKINSVVVSVENNHPKLVATLAKPVSGTLSSYTLTIGRADGPSGTFKPVGTVQNDGTFVDATANSAVGAYCYQVTYQGVCGLTLPPSIPVCTVFLSSTAKTSIDWTGESPFMSGPVIDYTVEVTDSLKGTTQKIPLGTRTHYEPASNDPNTPSYTYRIIAQSAGTTSYSNFITLQGEAKILLPDAFTPNSDGMNDEFLPKGISDNPFRMIIYSRWGEVVYSTTDKTKGWNGQINGEPAIPGQYMYRIEVEDTGGQKTVRTGAVLLLR